VREVPENYALQELVTSPTDRRLYFSDRRMYADGRRSICRIRLAPQAMFPATKYKKTAILNASTITLLSRTKKKKDNCWLFLPVMATSLTPPMATFFFRAYERSEGRMLFLQKKHLCRRVTSMMLRKHSTRTTIDIANAISLPTPSL
jgi:hypothetical protein